MTSSELGHYNSHMIVYEKDKNRRDNYIKIQKITNCRKFSAIDTINEYEKYVKFALENNYTDQTFINKFSNIKGKLGCNLSHQLLLKEILINSSTEWNLILEDDVVLKDYNVEKLKHLIKKQTKINHIISIYIVTQVLKKDKKKQNK